jgi:hypothetical protein
LSDCEKQQARMSDDKNDGNDYLQFTCRGAIL